MCNWYKLILDDYQILILFHWRYFFATGSYLIRTYVIWLRQEGKSFFPLKQTWFETENQFSYVLFSMFRSELFCHPYIITQISSQSRLKLNYYNSIEILSYEQHIILLSIHKYSFPFFKIFKYWCRDKSNISCFSLVWQSAIQVSSMCTYVFTLAFVATAYVYRVQNQNCIRS